MSSTQIQASSVLLGEQSLLVQCGDMLLERGVSIEAVVTLNPVIVDWCRHKGIPVLDSLAAFSDFQSEHELAYDLLFSITNLKVLSPALIRQPRRLAINFHDAPLPRYAGLNAPVWALLAGEQDYGVSWHIMEEEIDEGKLLVQQHFPIVPGETTFSLNAKCYQAGLESFDRLLDLIAADDLDGTSQNLSDMTYFGLNHRPGAAGTIDFNRSYAEVDRLVRALDFGPYPNPVCLPRLYLGSQVMLVRKAEFHSELEAAQPGQVMAASESSLSVSLSDVVVRFSELSCNGGQPVNVLEVLQSSGLSIGDCLPKLSVDQVAGVESTTASLCASEPYWHRRLARLEPIEAPYAKTQAGDGARECIEISIPDGGASDNTLRCFTALALLCGRLGMKQLYNIGLSAPSGDTEGAAQYFAQCLPLEVKLEDQISFAELEQALASQFKRIENKGGHMADLRARYPDLQNAPAVESLPVQFLPAGASPAGSAVLAFAVDPASATLSAYYASSAYDRAAMEQLLGHLVHLLGEVKDCDSRPAIEYGVVSPAESEQLAQWNSTSRAGVADACVHQLFEQQVAQDPDREALVFEGVSLSYGELNGAANRLARYLQDQGVKPGGRVGILVGRSADMMVALLASLKAGCAYVPLDPLYPADRLNYMVEDAGLDAVISQDEHRKILGAGDYRLLVLEELQRQLASFPDTNPGVSIGSADLAYVIYTSGSTGKPKGVMVEHRNVINFFAGMDDRVEPGPGVWLAVTSISFDISVLELFWTLARGLTILIYADERRQLGKGAAPVSQHPEKDIDFGLFYWNVATDESQYDTDKYRLLLEGAKFADTNGFNSVWTPERHFASFGGLFPNPAVTSAALATITENVELRAGSCVVPLHSPIRVAEEWSVVDNLSNGRVAIAVAAGWAPPDFAIKPENFADAKEKMFEMVDTVQQLWRGETLMFPGPQGEVAVRTLPRPIQPQLPIWVTTAGNEDTYRQAGKIGANILTHLLGQTIEDVAQKVAIYREEWQAAGHAGSGKVTLMLHTFIGDDEAEVEACVREPLKAYLKSAMFLVKSAAWQFPTFKKMSEDQGKTLDEFFDTISDEDMDALLEFAFQRYFHTSGLFGTPASAMGMVDKVKGSDIDEIACLIDFGIDTELALEHLPQLAELLAIAKAGPVEQASDGDYSIPALFKQHAISHFQCTPSMATMLAADPEVRPGLASLKQMMVGGEAFPPEVATELGALCSGRVSNMYGPTETTIWSSTGDVRGEQGVSVSIGKPLLNQQCHILDENQRPLPIGIAGELVIGGDGVVRGYHNRPDLTDDRFIKDPFNAADNARMYRTGDLARWLPDGSLECLGRVDHQVKIRGYRVELGEIEALLRSHESVMEAAVILREDSPGDKRLVAYVKMTSTSAIDASALREHLKQQLPEFMVPFAYIDLPALPLTPNGKIDRKALPAPRQAVSADSGEMRKPENEWEALIIDIWQRALGISDVSTRDNFFDIGGHSLLVVQVLKELREKLNKSLQMTDLFKYTTVESLARFVASDSEDNSAINEGQARAEKRRASRGRRRGRGR